MLSKITSLLLLVATYAMGSEVYHLKPVKVSDSLYCVIGDIDGPSKENLGFASNVCYANLGDKVVVIDAGPTYKFASELDALIQKQFHLPVSDVILTNYHDDRIQGASYFKEQGASIIGADTINEDIKKNPQKFERIVQVVSAEIYKKTKVVMADKMFEKSYVIKGKDYDIFLEKPTKQAQSPSDIIVNIPSQKFVFCGNIVFNERMINYAKDSNIEGWLGSLKYIESLGAKYVLGGHGANMQSDAYKTTQKYLARLKIQVEKAYDDGIELEEIMDNVDLKEFNFLQHFESLNGKNVYNYFMQLEWSE